MQHTIRQFLHRATTLPVIRPLMSRYFRGRCNVVFTHFVGRAVPPHYASFLPPRTDPDSFRQDIEQLSRQFEFVTLDALLSPQSQGQGSSNRPRMALTIDDGLDFFDDTMLSILADYDIQPCCFVITKYIDNTDLMWRHKLSAIAALTTPSRLQTGLRETWPLGAPPGNVRDLLSASFNLPFSRIDEFSRELWEACSLPPLNEYLEQYRPYLTWERIEALRNEGFQFGSHSHSHPAFDLLCSEDAIAEMRASKQALENRLGKHDYFFAYPFGRLPERQARPEIHRAGGYKGYFGTYGFSPASGEPGAFYHRIATEGSIESTALAPLYPAAALLNRIRRHNNPRG